MKFAHLADCHIGSWREQKLSNISTDAFLKAIDICCEKNVDFILLSGDMFNSSLPAIDKLKAVVKKLKELRDKGIPLYAIAGSHDFSPSGKTMLDVIEKADLIINVSKGEVIGSKLKLRFAVDKKTGAKITGMLGRKGTLEKTYYEAIDKESLEKEEGFKIFMFHTAITELKRKEFEKMDSAPVSYLPKGFDYYAGGHVHIVEKSSLDSYKNIVYPGPLFPNSFSEIEKLKHGGFYIYDNGKIEHIPIIIYEAECFELNCDYKEPKKIEDEILEEIKKRNLNNKIVTIRLIGKLKSGKINDIDFRQIFDKSYGQGAYFVMKSTSLLTTAEYEEIKIASENHEEIENDIINENTGKFRIYGMDEALQKEVVKRLISSLSMEKQEGEKVNDYEERLKKEFKKIINKEII